MSLNPFRFFILLAAMFTIVSCNWLDNNEETEVSTNPSFVSLRFTSSASGVSSAAFTLVKEEGIEDSVIVNLDSLPYKTDISKVLSTYSFKSVGTTYAYVTDSVGGIDTINISATTAADTIDYRWGVRILNYAADGKTFAKYVVKVNVHTVEPELYQWNRINSSIYSHAGSEQKALLFRDSIFFYVGSGLNNTLYKSVDGASWKAPVNISSLPDFAHLRNILSFKNKLFYAHQDSILYWSDNGIQWNKRSFGSENFYIHNLLFEMNNKLWAVAYLPGTKKYHFANSDDGLNWAKEDEVPTGFPVKGFAAHSFFSRTKVAKAIVVGGYTEDESIMRNIWSTENGSYWIDFSTEKTNLEHLAGATIVSYDDKLLMIGRMNDDGLVPESWFLESKDEGLSWKNTDTTYTQIRELVYSPSDTSYRYMEPRYFTSAIVRDKRIIVIGGRNQAGYFTDVWTGRLNRLNFLRQ
ncbi:MAG: hypothetical protein EOM47_02190 [Bacteroidia bacterium]|jgi:hypothetical protein|nr:DUF6242 domain-containing protein [Paludibacter sp.]MDD3490285.1 DUF6242 domain-containing protein [Paludibacter sp.]NCB67642.1 hypothetical protein [Bacteroidia bacterium]